MKTIRECNDLLLPRKREGDTTHVPLVSTSAVRILFRVRSEKKIEAIREIMEDRHLRSEIREEVKKYLELVEWP